MTTHIQFLIQVSGQSQLVFVLNKFNKCARFADFVCKFLCALIAFLIALQCKCENLLGKKQSTFTETSTPQVLFN